MAQPVVGDASIELARGRRAPYTQVGDWVALSTVSRGAKALYWLLAAHVNPQRDDGGVWPSRRALAEALGYAKVESVDPLVKELTQLGAVEVERRRHANGAPAPNRYVVHETPPAGYTGPTSLADFYDRRRRKTARPGVARYTGVPPSAGGGVPRSTGGGVPPCTGYELDQEDLDQEEPPPPTPSTVTGGTIVARPRGEGESSTIRPKLIPAEPDPASGVLGDLVSEVVAAQPGWSPESVRRVLAEAVEQGRAPAAVAAAARSLALGVHGLTGSPRRLLADGPWWAAAPVRPRPVPPREPCPVPGHLGDLAVAGNCAYCRADRYGADGRDHGAVLDRAAALVTIRAVTAVRSGKPAAARRWPS
jgi:hypothetical protein